jgi:hypothetical protein
MPPVSVPATVEEETVHGHGLEDMVIISSDERDASAVIQ